MIERAPEAEIISINGFRDAKRPSLPQRVPGVCPEEFTLPEPRLRLKLIQGVDILSNCVEIVVDNHTPIYDALVYETNPQ